MTVTIRADDALAERVLKALREDYEEQQVERGNAVHVSDLIFPRRTWLAKTSPKPMTDDDLLYFTAGRAHHEILENAVVHDHMREVRIEYRGIVGSVDVLDTDGSPVEVKTTRVKEMYIPTNVPDHFVTQLGCYVAMLNPEEQQGTAHLLVFYLGVKNKGTWRHTPKLKSFEIKYDNLPKIRLMMMSRKALLEGTAIPSTETCHSWLCRFCKWYGVECNGWGSDIEWRVESSR